MSRSAKPKRRLLAPDDMLQFIGVASPQISPDGSRIVFARKHIGKKNDSITNLWMVDTSGKRDPSQFTNGGRDGSPHWSHHGKSIAFVGAREKPRPQIFLISAAGGEARALSKFPEGSIASFLWSPNDRLIAVAFREQDPEWTEAAKKKREEKSFTDPPRVIDDWWYRLDGDGYFNAQRHKLYIVDVETGEHRLIYGKSAMGGMSFDFSPDSKKLAVTSNEDPKAMVKPWKDKISIVEVKSGRKRAVPGLFDGPKDAVRWSPDGKTLAFVGREGKDDIYSPENLEIWVCNPDKGNPRCLTGNEDYCLLATTATDAAEMLFGANIQWSPDSRRILAKIGWHGESHLAAIDRRGGKLRFLTKGAFDQDIGNASSDGRRIALTRSSAQTLSEIGVGEIGAKEARVRMLTDFNGPYFRKINTSPITSHWITASDGTRVQLWVILPPDHKSGAKKKFPGVLEIHGGPHTQYGVGFFNEFQVLAAQGYVVVYSNPRGSKGYGRDHCAAIRGKWGGADWIDIQAVIQFMQKHPNIDAKHMGVMGGSYGGYMTNWVIGHSDDFAGAITDRCVSNTVTMGGTSDYVEAPDQYFPGNFWDRPEKRWEQSPMRFIGNAKTPTLIIHSEGDLRCNIEQAEQLFSALKLLNVPTRFVRYPRSTSHGMSRGGPPDMRLHRLQQIIDWWKKYLGRKK